MWLAAVVGAAQEIEIHPLVRLGYRVQEKLLVTPLRRGRHNRHGRAAARQLALGDQQGNFALLDAQPYAITVMNISQGARSEEHTSELQSLMRISYAVFCLKQKKK